MVEVAYDLMQAHLDSAVAGGGGEWAYRLVLLRHGESTWNRDNRYEHANLYFVCDLRLGRSTDLDYECGLGLGQSND